MTASREQKQRKKEMSEHINLLGFFIESGMSVHDVVSLFLIVFSRVLF